MDRIGAGAATNAAGKSYPTYVSQALHPDEEKHINPEAVKNELYNPDVEQSDFQKKDSFEESPELKAELQRLAAIEREVIAHEQAHKSVGGSLAGAASYQYTRGPDGRLYVTGGEVPISTPAGGSLEETIRNMEIVQRAALAPAKPSPQDIRVAASAAARLVAARAELAKEAAQENAEKFAQKSEHKPIDILV